VAQQPAAGVPVLIYHEVGNEAKPPGETVIPLAAFTQQMQYLADHGYHPISMDELLAYMRWGASLPSRPVVLTFDDGWKNALNAVPVLLRHGFKASFWIITDKGIGGDYLDWPEIERIAAHPGFEVYSHTASHPWDRQHNLISWTEARPPEQDLPRVRAELAGSRTTLLARLHRPQPYLAWPCGWYNETLIGMAREAGYTALLSAEDGLNQRGGDVWRIKRTFVDGACAMKDFAASLEDGKYRICQTRTLATQGHRPPGMPEPK
jgi:peptidoglycan/xylan/chitin deacetylase (PgdA/CDA1 family)